MLQVVVIPWEDDAIMNKKLWSPEDFREWHSQLYLHPDAELAQRDNEALTSKLVGRHEILPIALTKMRSTLHSDWRICDGKSFDALTEVIDKMLQGHAFPDDVKLVDKVPLATEMVDLWRNINSDTCKLLRQASRMPWKPILWQDAGFLVSFDNAAILLRNKHSSAVLGESVGHSLFE